MGWEGLSGRGHRLNESVTEEGNDQAQGKGNSEPDEGGGTPSPLLLHDQYFNNFLND